MRVQLAATSGRCEACGKFQTITVDRTLRAAPNPFVGETRITFGSETEDEVVVDVLAPTAA